MTQKIRNMKIEKVLLIAFIGIFLLIIFWIKILGSSTIPINVEKNGYCIDVLGDDWKNIKDTNTCRNRFHISQEIEDIKFTEEEFRDKCKKNNFLSKSFYSDCFYSSGGLN